VLVTVSDKKLVVQFYCDPGVNRNCFPDANGNLPLEAYYYKADVITAGDYAPFGMALVGRKYSVGAGQYRYGFNGKENSDEIYSGAVSFEARIYDSRIGRFFSTDPRESEYAWQSTYVYFSNCPTSIVDNLGMGGTDPAPAGYYYDKVTKITTWLKENSTISSDQTYLGTEYYVTHRIDGIAGNSVTYRYKNNVESPETVNTQSESSEMMAINNNKETIATTRSNFSISFDNNTNNGSSETWVDGRSGFHKFAVSGVGGSAYDAGRGLWNSLTTWDGFKNLCLTANPIGLAYSLGKSAQNFSLPTTTTQWGNVTGQGMMFALPFMKFAPASTTVFRVQRSGQFLELDAGSNVTFNVNGGYGKTVYMFVGDEAGALRYAAGKPGSTITAFEINSAYANKILQIRHPQSAGLKSISASDYHVPGGQYRIGVHENKINGFLKWQVPGSGRIIIP
jgi:RHS repeat-associated protein